MKKDVDFSKAHRGPLKIPKGKTWVTIYLDDAVIESFRAKSEKTGKGYQTLINDTLGLALNTDKFHRPVPQSCEVTQTRQPVKVAGSLGRQAS